jgi:tetratricopeptide (TPR) repeat protein
VYLEYLAIPDRAANIPEFVNMEPGTPFSITESFLNDYNIKRQGDATVSAGDLKLAASYYKKALEMNPDNTDARFELANSYYGMGEIVGAER